MDLKLTRKTLKLEIDGEAYLLRFPNISELQNLSETKSEGTGEVKKLFIELGLPDAVFESLEAEHLKLIMEKFRPPKA